MGTSCFSKIACACRARLGCRLTTLFGDEDNKDWIPVVQNNVAPAKKRSLMPLLTVVFLASYGLMTLLIVEQGDTIQSQRNLIQILLGDSTELWPRRERPCTKSKWPKSSARPKL